MKTETIAVAGGIKNERWDIQTVVREEMRRYSSEVEISYPTQVLERLFNISLTNSMLVNAALRFKLENEIYVG